MTTSTGQPIEAPSSVQMRSERRPVYHPNTTLGVVGHVVKTAGILAPLIIGEVVKDTDKRWRWIRISPSPPRSCPKAFTPRRSSRNGAIGQRSASAISPIAPFLLDLLGVK